MLAQKETPSTGSAFCLTATFLGRVAGTFKQEKNMDDIRLTERRDYARQLCANKRVAIVPYGSAHWIKGVGVDLVIADLAWLQESDLKPYVAEER